MHSNLSHIHPQFLFFLKKKPIMMYPHRHVPKLQVTSQSFELCWHSSLPCNQELFYSRENLWMQLTAWKARKSAAFCTPKALGATQCTKNFASHHSSLCKYLQSEWHISRTPWNKTFARYIPLLPEGYLCLPFTPEAVGTSACFMEVFRGSPLQSSLWYTRAGVVSRGERGEREGWSLFRM